MRISDWSSDVCSSDLRYAGPGCAAGAPTPEAPPAPCVAFGLVLYCPADSRTQPLLPGDAGLGVRYSATRFLSSYPSVPFSTLRSEEHTSELQSLMRISYAVFCLKKKTTHA